MQKPHFSTINIKISKTFKRIKLRKKKKKIYKWHQILTLCLWCRRKKSSKKDFPLRKAPATDITTTFLSRISGFIKTDSNASSSKVNSWFSEVTTIWTGWPSVIAALFPRKKERKKKQKRKNNLKIKQRRFLSLNITCCCFYLAT